MTPTYAFLVGIIFGFLLGAYYTFTLFNRRGK
jgi:hypothetical protein